MTLTECYAFFRLSKKMVQDGHYERNSKSRRPTTEQAFSLLQSRTRISALQSSIMQQTPTILSPIHPSKTISTNLTKSPASISTSSFSIQTRGGRILHMPDFSAIARIFWMYDIVSLNSSHVGSKTGHSGGGTNSSFVQNIVTVSTPQTLTVNLRLPCFDSVSKPLLKPTGLLQQQLA